MDFNKAEVGVLLKKSDHGAILPSSKFLPYCLLVLGHSLMGAWDKTPLPHLQNGCDSRTQLRERMPMEYLVQRLAYAECSRDSDYSHTLKQSPLNIPPLDIPPLDIPPLDIPPLNILPLNILPIFSGPTQMPPPPFRIVLGLNPFPCSASDIHYLVSCTLAVPFPSCIEVRSSLRTA